MLTTKRLTNTPFPFRYIRTDVRYADASASGQVRGFDGGVSRRDVKNGLTALRQKTDPQAKRFSDFSAVGFARCLCGLFTHPSCGGVAGKMFPSQTVSFSRPYRSFKGAV